jgi:hypothetical protein
MQETRRAELLSEIESDLGHSLFDLTDFSIISDPCIVSNGPSDFSSKKSRSYMGSAELMSFSASTPSTSMRSLPLRHPLIPQLTPGERRLEAVRPILAFLASKPDGSLAPPPPLAYLSADTAIVGDYLDLLNNLGTLFANRDELNRAEACLRTAKGAFERLDDAPRKSECAHNAAGVGGLLTCVRKRVGRLYTSTLYFLAQVLGKLQQGEESAAFCQITLARQLVEGSYRAEVKALLLALFISTLISGRLTPEGMGQQQRAAVGLLFNKFKMATCSAVSQYPPPPLFPPYSSCVAGE